MHAGPRGHAVQRGNVGVGVSQRWWAICVGMHTLSAQSQMRHTLAGSVLDGGQTELRYRVGVWGGCGSVRQFGMCGEKVWATVRKEMAVFSSCVFAVTAETGMQGPTLAPGVHQSWFLEGGGGLVLFLYLRASRWPPI